MVAAIGLTTPTAANSVLTGLELLEQGQDSCQSVHTEWDQMVRWGANCIACLWIKTIWQGKPLNQWKLGALKSPIKEHGDFGIKVLLEYIKMFRNYVGGGQRLEISKLQPLWVEILTQTVRHKTADHSGVKVTNCRQNCSTTFSTTDNVRTEGSEECGNSLWLKQMSFNNVSVRQITWKSM